MAKAADAFLTGRPYGIRLDFKHKGFAHPYSDNRVDMKKLKAYNKYIYPLALILNRNL